ncbi:GNAT family N-acetyltransferase [Actinomadura scrupuli]|uniref:GNAT family N-acetyltransferase n=1 Tax=Actinomadura scrupuli TaxID=559629 RepID=UPI003D969835
MNIVIRKAGAESLDRLEPLWLALHDHHRSVMPGYTYHPDERSWAIRRVLYGEWIKSEGSFVLLAERAEELLGYAFVHVRDGVDDTWVTGERTAEVQTLSVAPGERGNGIGTRLLDAVDAELENLGIGDLFIGTLAANSGAQQLYERRGLRPVWVYLGRVAASPPS